MLIKKEAVADFPTSYGDFKVHAYQTDSGEHHLALVKGDIKGDMLVRVHSECLTGDALFSLRCDCGEQLHKAMKMIGEQGGVLLYLRQEGRGIGLVNKLKAYELQDKGMDTVEANGRLGFKADLRDYAVGARILADLGSSTIRLLTNNPTKIKGLEKYGLKVVERVPIITEPHEKNRRYLETKQAKLGHMLDLEGFV